MVWVVMGVWLTWASGRWCGVMFVCVLSLHYLCGLSVQVSVYCARNILGAPSVQSCCTLSISASDHVFVYDRYCKSRLACVWLSDLD